MSHDYSARPFVAGTITGIRAFAVDDLGRLSGPSYPQIFKPGENEANCSTRVRSGPFAVEFPRNRKPHTPGSMACSCGFYAYFDGSNDFHHSGRVEGIIEGYGIVTVGDRGFKAQRARLVALILTSRRWHRRYDRLSDWLNKHKGIGAPLAIIQGLAALYGGLMSLLFGIGGNPFALLGLVPSLVMALSAVTVGKADFHAIDRRYVSGSALTWQVIERVRANYPDVPTYPTREAAMRAHPLTPPALPSPETHPDFWEMP